MPTRIVKDHGLKVGAILEALEMDGVTRTARSFFEVVGLQGDGKVNIQALETGYLGLHKEVPVIGSNYGPIETKAVREDCNQLELGRYVATKYARAYVRT